MIFGNLSWELCEFSPLNYCYCFSFVESCALKFYEIAMTILDIYASKFYERVIFIRKPNDH